ncbi:GntR family transcriptional regulator [Streptomyces sp. p1417]|uniref:GntR family transcriptional regulator n=1 Tax=Streptomyces typhae TaxID=2681492 RepID=A0A6L6WQW7_9ACTN|nr:GntR family transcriptional regulator [Streptomyces typhae]MVO84635.1 GntR family transcriptional regulator [Streptomyces typhae]
MTVPATDTGFPDRRSLHERIASDLRDEIMSGDLPPGAKLPSTNQLKARFEASNATIQKALQLLKDEQLVIGRAGAAVTVREHRQQTMRPASYMAPADAGKPYRWLSENTKPGVRARSTLLDVAELEPPADVASALNLTGGLPVLRTLRVVHSDDDRPIEATVMVMAGHLHELQYEFTAE